MSNSKKSKILIQMTGSIACFKACALISKLVQAGHHVKVVASKSALQFVGAATLEGLTGEPVVSDLWESGEAMSHIHLMRWADVIAVVPASAHFINRISMGVGDDLLTTMFLAHDFKKPYLIAPAMNTSMYLHPVTQKSIRALKEMGTEILESASGVLACGEVGYGRLLEPDLLFNEVERSLGNGNSNTNLTNNSAGASNGNGVGKSNASAEVTRNKQGPDANFKILLTSGGTQEPIDGVRVIGNLSTGGTGAELVDWLTSLGFSVVHVHALNSARSKNDDVERLTFQTSQDLSNRLQERLKVGNIGAVVHLAAVSDFVLSAWEQNGTYHSAELTGKISSKSDLTLRLVRNEKILGKIRGWSPHPLHLTAFKMTSQAKPDDVNMAVQRVFETGQPNVVVHNDTDHIQRDKGVHLMTLFADPKDLSQKVALGHRAALAEWLAQEYSNAFAQDSRRNV